METIRAIILSSVILVMLSPVWLFAYEPNSTHDALTHEVADFYNEFAVEYGTPVLTPDDRLLLQKGAMAEDDNYRMAHHFYDPVYHIGLNHYYSSKDWAQSPSYQASWRDVPWGCLIQPKVLFPLFESPCDRTWQRAIYEYAHGDKRNAMEALGHTLHLIEDASVPDHTRNDAHIPIFDDAIRQYDESFAQKSPFEGFADQFSIANGNVRTKEELVGEGARPYEIFTLDEFFDNTAAYSNSNFFSKSTIFDDDYSLPINQNTTTKRINGNSIILGNYNGHPLVRIIIEKDETTLEDSYVYDLKTPEDYLLKEYWQLTSREAVKNGAGVVRLFFLEVEKERQTQTLLRMKEPLVKQLGTGTVKGIAKAGNAGARLIAFVVGGVGSAGKYAASGVTWGIASAVDAVDSPKIATISPPSPTTLTTGVGGLNFALKTTGESVVSQLNNTLVPITPTAQDDQSLLARLSNEIARISRLIADIKAARIAVPSAGEVAGASIVANPYVLYSNSLGGGGGGGTVIFLADASVVTAPIVPEATTTVEDIVPADVFAPDAPVIYTPSESELFATTSVAISGSAEAGAVVALSWLADAATVVFETRATTTGDWSAQILLPVGTTTIGVVAIDETGNVSPLTLLSVIVELPAPIVLDVPAPTVMPSPHVLFNEVAWGGTSASPDDEWIELYNAGDAPADLSRYRIVFGRGPEQAFVPLNGLLGPGNYFVLANKMGALDTEMPETPPYPIIQPWVHAMLPLADSGMELTLIDVSLNGDFVVDSIPYCEDWCGKGAVGVSMERWRTELITDAWDNWEANDGNFTNGIDRDGNGISGTPGARNSLNYLLSLSSTIDGIQSFAKGQGAYVLFSALTIPAGSSLTLGAGTVVKWMPNTGKLVVYGALEAIGTPEAPVVFTAIDDDTAGGDTLRDGEEPIHRNSSMHAITLSGASSTALFVDTEIRYAGTAIELINHASTTLISSTISDSQQGILLWSSSLSGEDTTFVDLAGNTIVAFASSTISLASTTIAHNGADALVVFDSALALASTTFTEVSGVGIDAFGSSVNATNTVFDVVHVTKNAIDLFDNRRSGLVSTGIFDGVTVANMGAGDVFNLIGSHATVTNMLAKGGESDAITLSGSSTLNISFSTVDHFADTAFRVFSSIVTAEDVALTDNKYGIWSFRSSIDIEHSTIEGNTISGVANMTPTFGAPLDATANYWGDANGPTLAGEPAGTAGDSVTLGVLTGPFLDTVPE